MSMNRTCCVLLSKIKSKNTKLMILSRIIFKMMILMKETLKRAVLFQAKKAIKVLNNPKRIPIRICWLNNALGRVYLAWALNSQICQRVIGTKTRKNKKMSKTN